MIRPRPSAFSRYFANVKILQNLKTYIQPKTHTISLNKFGKNPHTQKRNFSAYSQKEPDNEPPFWLLIAAGSYILYNLGFPPKKEN